jgi:hypothetical protein
LKCICTPGGPEALQMGPSQALLITVAFAIFIVFLSH